MIELPEAIRRLEHPTPIIYSILGQAWPDQPEEGYTANLLALHGRIRRESRALSEALRAREGGSAAETGWRPQAAPDRLGPFDSRQYRYTFPADGGPALLRFLPVGKKYLESLGFAPGGPGTLQESEFHLFGSAALDFLEIVVRDRVGIDRGAHGTHVRSISAACFIVRNRILEIGRRAAESSAWAVLYFEKPGVPGIISYDIFRAALRTILEDHLDRGSFAHATLDQRKLGLGRGSEFCLRVQLPRGPDEPLDRFLHDLFHDEGALETLRFALTLQEEIPAGEMSSAPGGV